MLVDSVFFRQFSPVPAENKYLPHLTQWHGRVTILSRWSCFPRIENTATYKVRALSYILLQALFDSMLERLHSLRKLRGYISSWPYMIIGVFLFFILDIVAFICIGKLLLDARRSISHLDNLDFRDPYVGLDKLYESHRVNSSRYNPVINEPRFSAQISPEQANEVFPIDAHRWLSDFGLLSPPDRRFQVSSKKQVR